jgi:hypothetical protein
MFENVQDLSQNTMLLSISLRLGLQIIFWELVRIMCGRAVGHLVVFLTLGVPARRSVAILSRPALPTYRI